MNRALLKWRIRYSTYARLVIEKCFHISKLFDWYAYSVLKQNVLCNIACQLIQWTIFVAIGHKRVDWPSSLGSIWGRRSDSGVVFLSGFRFFKDAFTDDKTWWICSEITLRFIQNFRIWTIRWVISEEFSLVFVKLAFKCITYSKHIRILSPIWVTDRLHHRIPINSKKVERHVIRCCQRDVW